MIKTFGVQLWTIRDHLGTPEQVRESFRKLKAMGYDEIQTAGMPISYEEFGTIAREEGLTIVGTHDNFEQMLTDTALSMQQHRALGTTRMGVGGKWFEGGRDDVTTYIAQVNTLAEKIRPHGFSFTYHNHSHEFVKLNGTTIFEQLVEGFTADNISFVLDTYWVQHGGGDVRYWLERLRGRVEVLHLKDMARDADGPKIAEIGNGNLWWDGILQTAVDTGVKHFVVEQDFCDGDPFDSLQQSMEYLKKFRG